MNSQVLFSPPSYSFCYFFFILFYLIIKNKREEIKVLNKMEGGRWERENAKVNNLEHEKYVLSVPFRFFQFLETYLPFFTQYCCQLSDCAVQTAFQLLLQWRIQKKMHVLMAPAQPLIYGSKGASGHANQIIYAVWIAIHLTPCLCVVL